MAKHSILIARFPYGGGEDYRGVNWLVNTVAAMKKDRRIGDIHHVSLNDTPITMTRNLACKMAIDLGVDYVLMIDNDIVPDWQAAKPFWDSSFEFLLGHHGPAMVAAPYCGPPPVENIFVFRWRIFESDTPDLRFSLQQYTREEAFERAGIETVAALPTGLLLMHTDCLHLAPKPWFEYEYTDEFCTEKATTEDVYFTRNCSLEGAGVYCNWDSWAGHVKKKVVGRPQILTAVDLQVRAKKVKDQNRDGRVKLVELHGKPPRRQDTAVVPLDGDPNERRNGRQKH